MSNTFEQSTYYDGYVNATSVFGEVKKHILSKDFKFGSITNVFGRATIDFTAADINGSAVIDVSQLFGEVRVKVPANWHVITGISNIFSQTQDQRANTNLNIDVNKVLVIEGISVFGVVRIINSI